MSIRFLKGSNTFVILMNKALVNEVLLNELLLNEVLQMEPSTWDVHF